MFNLSNFKIRVTFTLALTMALFFVSHHSTEAALLLTTPAETDTVEFTIPDTLIKSWQGSFQLPSNSSAESDTVSVAGLIRASLAPESKTVTVNAQRITHNPSLVYEWLSSAGNVVESDAKEPALEMQDGRVVSFTPPQVGQRLDMRASALVILSALGKNETEVKLITHEVKPTRDLASTNDIGIKELVGRGESNFKGSPKNRRINIKVGVAKMAGIIIKPGEEFSFNENLGPVEKEYGFVPELVIKATGTVPELGGGLCQVSSTTFRAAMDAGLPITQRRNHAYAVQYYSPQGTDATIYPGVVDLKFTNDTPGNILVWPYLKDDDNLIFDFYGTKDDRKVVLEKPLQWDRQASGAMKASWTRIVTKDGKEDKVTFQSVYQSPALFHKTEEFVANPQNPTGAPQEGQPIISPPTSPPGETPVDPAPPATEGATDEADEAPPTVPEST